MLPDWVRHLEDYEDWIETVVNAGGARLLGLGVLEIGTTPSRKLPGVGVQRGLYVPEHRLGLWAFPGLELAIKLIVAETRTFDGDLLPLEHLEYGFHLRSDTGFVWRYDCHDDHHGLGTRFHVHEGTEGNVRASGEVTLDDIFGMIEAEFKPSS